jgi:DNA replication protein DnaC
MSQTPREAVIQEDVKLLKRPAIGREYQALARQARDGGWAYEDYLKELLEREMHARHEHTAALRLKPARFPDVKTLDQLAWTARQGVSRPKVLELASCDYLRTGDDVIVVGPVGTGKGIVKLLGIILSPGNSRYFPDVIATDPPFRRPALSP